MATIKKTIDITSKLTKEQLKMLKEAENTPYSYDEDNPLLTKEELAKFSRVSERIQKERESKRKENVTLRLSPNTVRKAKSLGKGYTKILAQIIEDALNDPDLIKG
ncbi:MULTISPECIES: BrnA antitoxin family protein [unclassified Butyrivibrio]|uniref:BrnA antitoxin family protein n=1 Tax=unclassified Butyrivibrio TaxID=2639466 RepID=UPI00040EF57B|nr:MULTISPECIES: BrnA antitoxin family protein [unclassified Butyrivibrio]